MTPPRSEGKLPVRPLGGGEAHVHPQGEIIVPKERRTRPARMSAREAAGATFREAIDKGRASYGSTRAGTSVMTSSQPACP